MAAPVEAATVPMLRPQRGGVGTVGRGIRLETNFFQLSVKGLPVVYQYDVEILAVKRSGSGAAAPGRGAAGHGKGAAGASAAAAASAANAPDPADLHDVSSSQPVVVNRNIFRRYVAQSGPRLASRVAYDGRKIAYAASELPEAMIKKQIRIECNRDGGVPTGKETKRVDVVYVVLKHVGTLDTAQALKTEASTLNALAQPVINALDVALSEGNTTRYVEVGRTFYSKVNASDLGGGIQAWRGFYQSIRMTEGGLAVNVDESYTPFWKDGSLLQLCATAAQRGTLPQPRDAIGWKTLGKTLLGLRVRASHTGITYRVCGFSPAPASATTFPDRVTGKNISVAQYMEKEYGVRLAKAELPCVRTHPKRDIFIPLELLEVCSNQRRTRAMNPLQTSNMIRAAAVRPHDRRVNSQKSIASAKYNEDETCKAFSISVNPRLMSVRARILPTPTLEYAPDRPQGGANRRIEARNGAWNMQNAKMLNGSSLMSWIVVRVGRIMDRNAVQTFVSNLVRIGQSNGVRFHDTAPKIHELGDRNFEAQLTNLIDKTNEELANAKKHRLQLILVVKDQQDNILYNAVKRVCDIKRGVVSQCTLAKKIVAQHGGKIDQYCANLMLKINAKLGGHNVKVPPFDERQMPNPAFMKAPHIVLGADVTHPAPGSYGRPSVAALVGSRDLHGIQFTGSLRNQPSRQEIITDMGEMFLEVYRRWFENFTPRVHAQAIIMFRDGVSEGQYQQVLDVELKAIRTACRSACHINPKITFIIVTKRHHTRFFGADDTPATALDRHKNVLPGTVIDTGITSANTWDFYLNSHAGIQGTNRPSKYTVLHDENNLTADQLQGYIFRLSHGFARCTRSVSMVNSAHYAHLLAFRGRIFLGDDGSDEGSVVSTGSVVPVTEKPHANLEKFLFFV
jgi:eukaryotic translation initiation factor 2C